MFFVSLRYPSRGGKDIPTAKASRAVDTVRICRSQVFLLHVLKQRTSVSRQTSQRVAAPMNARCYDATLSCWPTRPINRVNTRPPWPINRLHELLGVACAGRPTRRCLGLYTAYNNSNICDLWTDVML